MLTSSELAQKTSPTHDRSKASASREGDERVQSTCADDDLPTARELERRFGLFGGAASAGGHELITSEGGSVRCACTRCLAWAEFINHGLAGNDRQSSTKQYEVFTRELVAGLAGVLLSLRAALQAELPGGRELRVLELGAGSGRLAHLLRAELASRGPGPEGVLLIASDILERDPGAKPRYPILAADYRQALKLCMPDVVLACWMPLGDDWTAAMRQTPSVHAYLLVGDTSGVLCGDPVKTWGRSARSRATHAAVPERAHGWHLRELVSLSECQLCMADEPWSNLRHSRTVLAVRDGTLLESDATLSPRGSQS